MDLKLSDIDDAPLVLVSGDIDHGTCKSLQTALEALIDDGHGIVLVDLSDVGYIDSGGLSVFFAEGRRLTEGGWLGLIAPGPDVRRLLEIVGLYADTRFRVFPDQATAQASLPTGADPL